jgi:membrane dipeptidase
MVKWCIAWALMVLVAGCSSSAPSQPSSTSRDTSDTARLERAHAIHRSAPLIDGHNDLPWEIRTKGRGDLTKVDFRSSLPEAHTDLPRLRAGGVGAVFFAAYIPYSAFERKMAARMTLEQIDLIHRMVEHAPDALAFAQTADEIERIHRSGKIAVLIGIESGHAIENSLALLRQYYQLGARYMTLTHTTSVDWADAAGDESPQHGGLAPFGEEVVREMNRLGMMVDLSHVSDDAMRDAIRVTEAPIIFSHSSARALAGDQPRDVPDDLLRLTKGNNGVVMVNFYSGYLLPEPKGRESMGDARRRVREQFPGDDEATDAARREAMRKWSIDNPLPRGDVNTVADHIDHIVKIAGIDHVGIGSDFDGVGTLPEGLDDVSKFPNLTAELLRRGYREADVKKILGGNVLRAMRDVEATARRLSKTRRPSMATTVPSELMTDTAQTMPTTRRGR